MTERYSVTLSIPLPDGEVMGVLDEATEASIPDAIAGAAGTELGGTGSGFGHRDFSAVTTDRGAVLVALSHLLRPGSVLAFRQLEADGPAREVN